MYGIEVRPLQSRVTTNDRTDDYEFCVLPLTSDISINPFRCQRQTSQGSRLLFHSILALCCQHLRRLTGSWDTEAGEHHRKALQLLDDALKQKQTISQLNLLEPILILFTFDVRDSSTSSNPKLMIAH